MNEKTFEWCGKCRHWTTTHNTETHTGRIPDSNPSNEANVGLVVDPSAWYVELETPSVQDLWFVFGPMIMSFVFGALVSCVWAHSVEVRALFQHWQEILSTIILITMAFLAIYFRPEEKPPDSLKKQSKYRWKHRNKHRRKFHPGSIRDHGLRRQYPRRLRSLGRYTNRSQAPSYNQQRVNQQIDHLHQQTLSVLKCVDMKGRRPVRHSLQGDSMAKWHRGPVLKKERSHPTRGPVYRTPLTSWNGGHWNRRMPQRQEQAVRKIICHVHMATTQPSSQDITPAVFRAALMSPTRFRSTLPKHSTFSVIWDSGASMSITPDKRDFVGPLKSPGLKTKLQGIAKGLRIEGHGHVMWAMHDSEGMLRLIKLPAYYVPKSNSATTEYYKSSTNLFILKS
ncbi:MAG: hypothetical protein MZW92_54390 [Comamonadaceae bacterium]|nr:hypothetical protein [Comamonadaceae bacterium]